MRGVNLYAGPGGHDEGIRLATDHLEMIGLEYDSAACATGEAAGHTRFQVDLETYRPKDFILWDPEYLHGSPPCGGFTLNGRGTGRQDLPALQAITHYAAEHREQTGSAIDEFYLLARDPRSPLSLEPLRWVSECMPRLVTLEQVQAVMPLWLAYREALEAWGYHVWTGFMSAEQYGAPQVRRRSVLAASLEEVHAPTPTHSAYHKHAPEKLDPGVPRWVTMAEGLGWEEGRVLDVNNQTKQDFDLTWPWRRPSLAVTGARLVPMPGDFNKRSKNDGILVTETEAAVLQTFRPDYPFKGNKGEIRRQIGDAFPPVMSAALVGALL